MAIYHLQPAAPSAPLPALPAQRAKHRASCRGRRRLWPDARAAARRQPAGGAPGMENGPFIDDLPWITYKQMVIFHSYVSQPEAWWYIIFM